MSITISHAPNVAVGSLDEQITVTASQGAYKILFWKLGLTADECICVEKSFRLEWGAPRSRMHCLHTTGSFTIYASIYHFKG